jgi:hypothetical protein
MSAAYGESVETKMEVPGKDKIPHPPGPNGTHTMSLAPAEKEK